VKVRSILLGAKVTIYPHPTPGPVDFHGRDAGRAGIVATVWANGKESRLTVVLKDGRLLDLSSHEVVVRDWRKKK
jgi:hypothetical protein